MDTDSNLEVARGRGGWGKGIVGAWGLAEANYYIQPGRTARSYCPAQELSSTFYDKPYGYEKECVCVYIMEVIAPQAAGK